MKLMHEALDELYDIDQMTLTTDKDVKISDEIWEQAVHAVYDRADFDANLIESDAVMALINETYSILVEAVNKGISVKVTDEFKAHLKKNVYIFSGFKTAVELKEVSALLRDDSGVIKSFGQFASDIRQINEDYNQLYLRAEYRFAQQSATMASKWKRWEERGVQMLQYRTAADDHVRPEHALLDGVTRPFNDKFWDKNMPPNGWRCRCTVVPVDPLDASETPADEAERRAESVNMQPKQRIFRFNPGKDEIIYPPKHPYYKQSEDVKSKIDNLADRHNDEQ